MLLPNTWSPSPPLLLSLPPSITLSLSVSRLISTGYTTFTGKLMKIFNWVHRRFHHKDELGGDLKKTEFVSNATDTQALLEHVIPAHVLDGWRELGILTIGTFGFTPSLKEFNQQKECPTTDHKDSEEEEEEEECDEQVYSTDSDNNELEDENDLNPLVFAAYKTGLDKEMGSDCDQNVTYNSIVDHLLIMDNEDIPHEHDKMKKKERTTLADLLSADAAADVQGRKGGGEGKVVIQGEAMMSKKGVLHGKKNKGFSFAKKLIPRVGEDSQPIRKLLLESKSLMTKMLKRKIHPDLERKIQKIHIETKLNVSGHKFEANESASLLQTQDVVF